MLNLSQKLQTQDISRSIRDLLFFILFYLWLWLGVDLKLIFHGGGAITNFPVFFKGWFFFQQFLSYPGGLLEYLSAFLCQFFYYSWAGALIVTLQAWLIYLCTDKFIKAIKAPSLRFIRFLGPLLLLITYNRYTFYFPTTLAFLASLIFVYFYLKITRESSLFRLAIFLILSVIFYTIAGGAYLLFAALAAIYELSVRRRWLLAPAYLISAAGIPYIEGVLLYNISIINAYTELLPTCRRHHTLNRQAYSANAQPKSQKGL